MKTRLRFPKLLALGVAVAATAAPWSFCHATVVTLQSGISPSGTYQTQDAHVRNNPSTGGNTGVNQADNNTRIVFGSLATTSGVNPAIRGLFSYPLTGIPSGATINSVSFTVIQVDADSPASVGGPLTVELHSISRSFTEGTGNPTNPTGGSTWNNTFADAGNPMALGSTLATATMNPDPIDSGGVTPVTGSSSTWITTTFGSTLSLVNAVQTQLNANQPFNFALTLTAADEVSGVRKIFRVPSNSEQNFNGTIGTLTTNRPALIIDYTAIPEASSLLMVSAVATIGYVARKRRAG